MHIKLVFYFPNPNKQITLYFVYQWAHWRISCFFPQWITGRSKPSIFGFIFVFKFRLERRSKANQHKMRTHIW